MTKRRRFSEREVIETLWHQGARLLCFRCKGVMMPVLLGPESELYFPVQREHVHEIALGGKDSPDNCRYSHTGCHKIVTDGNGATTAGSSKGKIKKMRHIRTGKMEVKKHAIFRGDHEWDSSKPKRKFPKSKKLRSRNTFQKREKAA